MSLADLVPIAVACSLEREPMDEKQRLAAKARRWREKHRAEYNSYRRAWRQQRRDKGLPVT